MQPEQQKRILGYFLEEAREHLNTIEQGLLNLQSTLNDSEMINEVFRAAHSIKGGAAMLGLSSIQHTSHQLEDCFKILKEHPIQVDQRLESLLLDICDTLKALVDNLGNPFGLSEEKAQALMSKTEPVMQWLNKHIETLLKQGNGGVTSFNNSSLTRLQLDTPVPIQVQKLPVTTKQNQDWTEFQTQVLQILREMLQQFKQTNLGNSRENLQECCHQLAKIGKDLNLSNWCGLCESAALAISNPNNSYLTLAKIIITEIKQAQELVFQNRDAEIAISQQLETLFPLPQRSLLELEESLFSASVEIVAKNQQSTTSNSLNKKEFDLIFEEQEESFNLFFTSDTDNEAQAINNLFDVVVEANSSSSTVPIVESRELFLPEINNFPQSPEELNSIPEFTYQPSETTTNIQLLEILENSNNHNLILLEEEIISSASDVSENLITNTERNDLAIFAEAESNLNFTSNFADFNLKLESNSTTTELAADVFVVGETSPELELENPVEISLVDEFAEIEALLNEPAKENSVEASLMDEFAEIEAFLAAASGEITNEKYIQDEDFAALEALLGENEDDKLQIFSLRPAIIQPAVVKSQNTFSELGLEDEFSELENLLKQADKTISSSSATSQKTSNSKIPRPITRRTIREESMKIPVKQLDDMSNLVGELVVNCNTLEQDHERLRQSLDTLLVQVQHLSDVGVRMQQYYERSLLEASLLSSRRSRESDNSSGHSYNRGFSEIEMDRFTPFHSLAQEMIEFIVRVRESASDIDFVTEETEQVARQLRQATSQLQEGLTKARMVPFTQAIDRLRRGVRDNAIRYGKQVELVTEGVDTLVDKMILDHLTDPLTHMVNNAIAHGIETPQVRQAAGKSPVGTINIRALQQGNQTIISVSDDGAGIDHEKVKNKAVKKGILTPEQAKIISRIETYELLFLPSFSTADEVDDIKGRGVGMNVVHNDISEIRGTVGTDSKLGKGTTFTIRLPLTLSICKALFCICDRTRIAFPMDGVEDTLNIPAKNVQKDADGESFIVWRETILPFKPLKEILVFNRQLSRGNVYGTKTDDDMISVIIVRSGNTMIALEIDQVLSEQEIVIKQFEGPAPKPSGVAGATVLGDGMIMPIADVLEIIDIFQGKMSKHIGGNWQRPGLLSIDVILAGKVEITVLIVDDSITVREFLSLTFTKAGYRVEQARDGQEAWDKLRSGLPCDIVFCDIEMPRCDGLEFLSRIQKDGSFGHLPIAMLTSRDADKHRQMALQLGASGYFTKPYLEEALLEAASRMLKGENLVATT